MHSSLTHLAGTDGARHEAFVGQAGEFAAQWREQLRDRLFLDRMLSQEELAALPRFKFEEPAGFGRAALTVAYLIVLIGAATLLLSRALRNSQLR